MQFISKLLLCASLLASLLAFSQTLPVGTPVFEENWRRMQIKGLKDINRSFTIRPLSNKSLQDFDSAFFYDPQTPKREYSFLKEKGAIRILPLSIKQQFNSHHPFGWNDGPMIQAKGYQSSVSAGVYTKIGPVSIQLQPEFVFAQNKDFPTFPTTHSDSVWRSYYYVLNRIDNPEKFGTGSYAKVFPGQSSVRLNFKKLSIGVSTENLWWGPGLRNSLILSNNAPGFKHVTFNTTSPIITPVGSFEWQIISGIFENSNVLTNDTSRTFNGQKLYNPKVSDSRYLNAMIVSWQPKWTKGLHLGFTRAFYQYKSSVSASLNGYIPVISSFFKNEAQSEDKFGRDQLLSFFIRMILPESKAEFYGEYGRNDHSANLRDFMLEPDHARAYILGARKIFERTNNKEFELFFEFTHLQNPTTKDLRALEGWYTHYQVRHGYTNRGQVVGAGIGPGSNSQSIGLNWLNGFEKVGLSFERIVRNNDFYHDAFEPSQNFGSHWVDLFFGLNKNWLRKHFIYTADLALVRSLNYQWRYKHAEAGKDVSNLHAKFSVVYLF